MKNQIAYHYTYGDNFAKIIESGVIRRAVALIDVGEKPVVWFTLNPIWDPTVNKAAYGPEGEIVFLTKEETAQYGNGLFRFGVPLAVAPLTWSEIRQQSGMSPDIAKALEETANEKGSDPREWRGTFDDVPLSKCVAIDFWYQGKWIDAAENQDKFINVPAATT